MLNQLSDIELFWKGPFCRMKNLKNEKIQKATLELFPVSQKGYKLLGQNWKGICILDIY